MWMVVDGWLDGYVDGCGWLADVFLMVVDGYWLVVWMVVDGYWMVLLIVVDGYWMVFGWLWMVTAWCLDG